MSINRKYQFLFLTILAMVLAIGAFFVAPNAIVAKSFVPVNKNDLPTGPEVDYLLDLEERLFKKITPEKAYERFSKIYRPFNPLESLLSSDDAKNIWILMSLTDLASIQKFVLLDFIYAVSIDKVPRDEPIDTYYEQIFDGMEMLDLEGPLERLRADLITGIKHHREALDSWLTAARENDIKSVQNERGVWVHPGTSAGDSIFYNLYFKYIKTEFANEAQSNLDAISRHLCVLVF